MEDFIEAVEELADERTLILIGYLAAGESPDPNDVYGDNEMLLEILQRIRPIIVEGLDKSLAALDNHVSS